MGAQAKAKAIRLIDLFNTINESEIVLVTTNHGRTTFSDTVRTLELKLKEYLTCEIIAITVSYGTLQIFV